MDGQDDAIDWRARAVTTLAKDVPAAYPGGPSHRAGARVVLVTTVKSADPGGMSFTTPSAAALALSIAIKAFDAAVVAKGQLGFVETVTPHGPGKAIVDERIPALFDFLDQCMIMVTFSFEALEAYCNQIIDERLDGTYRYTKKTKTGVQVLALTAAELERTLATEEKLGEVVPSLLGIASPKGKAVWANFVGLKRMRDAVIHLKSVDQYPNRRAPGHIDEDSVFYRFLTDEIANLPKASVELMFYFSRLTFIPPWLEQPWQRFEIGR